MTRFFKAVALLALISCGVWIAVLWHWQATARDISTRDILIYLGALPATLFVFALLLRWAWLGVGEKLSLREVVSVAGAGPRAGPEPVVEDAARHATVQLLAAHLVCAAGSSAGDLQAAARDGAPRPGLDPELRDEDGLPIIAARIREIEIAALESQLEPLLLMVRARRPEWADQMAADHVVRALAALEGPLCAAVESLLPWADRFVTERSVSGPSGVAVEGPQDRRVRVLLGLPAEWNSFEQELGRACAAEWLASSGGVSISSKCFVIAAHAGPGEELLMQADRLLQTLAREDRDEPAIVAACHSSLSDRAIESMERTGVLFGPKRPKGRMPGEAAAALLLAGANWPAAPDAEGPLPHLHRPTVLRRDKSVDAPGRINGELVGQAITQALGTSRLGADAIAGLVCDADMHSARAAEFYDAAVGLMPALDSVEDTRLLATITGAVGVVSPLMVLACAAERACAAEQPHLAVTLGDEFARLAMVVLPAPPYGPNTADRAGAQGATKVAAT